MPGAQLLSIIMMTHQAEKAKNVCVVTLQSCAFAIKQMKQTDLVSGFKGVVN